MTPLINEFYVKRIATDFPSETLRERVQFTPIVPAPFAEGKYMGVLVYGCAGAIDLRTAQGARFLTFKEPRT